MKCLLSFGPRARASFLLLTFSLNAVSMGSDTPPLPPQGSLSVQFSSVAQSCLTLCNPMDCSTPGFPVWRRKPLKGPIDPISTFPPLRLNRFRNHLWGAGERNFYLWIWIGCGRDPTPECHSDYLPAPSRAVELGDKDSNEAGGPRGGRKSFSEGRLFAERDPWAPCFVASVPDPPQFLIAGQFLDYVVLVSAI